jgi:hypothetical protein
VTFKVAPGTSSVGSDGTTDVKQATPNLLIFRFAYILRIFFHRQHEARTKVRMVTGVVTFPERSRPAPLAGLAGARLTTPVGGLG